MIRFGLEILKFVFLIKKEEAIDMGYERREFLKKASLATAAISLGHSVNAMSSSSYNNIIGANERINLAIQGLGRRYGAYIDGIVAPESNARIAYLCDVMPGQMDKAAQAVGTKIDYEPKLKETSVKYLTIRM